MFQYLNFYRLNIQNQMVDCTKVGSILSNFHAYICIICLFIIFRLKKKSNSIAHIQCIIHTFEYELFSMLLKTL